MNKTIELRQKRAGLIKQARDLYEERSEGGTMTAEDTAQFDALMAKADEMRSDIERVEKLEAAEKGLQEPMQRSMRPAPGDGTNGQELAVEFFSRGMKATDSYDKAWMEQRAWQRLFTTANPDYQKGFRNHLRTGQQFRALQADSDTAGGYLVTPLQFTDRLIKDIDDMVHIRQWGTVFSVPNADGLGAPVLENDPADADWTTELQTGSEDSTMSFGRRELHPHPLAKLIKVSRKLLMKVPDSENLVRNRLAYKFAITWEKAALTGSGSGQPLGVFTASADGISTGQDVSTGNTTTSIQFDGLIEAKYSIKQGYWANARWLFHRNGMKQIAKLKDGNGQYLWRESVRAGEPDRLLGNPAYISEYAPSTFTTGQYVGIFGDFSYYWIADSMGFDLQRLVELYAATNQVGMIGRLESDGMPVLEEAFARVTLA